MNSLMSKWVGLLALLGSPIGWRPLCPSVYPLIYESLSASFILFRNVGCVSNDSKISSGVAGGFTVFNSVHCESGGMATSSGHVFIFGGELKELFESKSEAYPTPLGTRSEVSPRFSFGMELVAFPPTAGVAQESPNASEVAASGAVKTAGAPSRGRLLESTSFRR